MGDGGGGGGASAGSGVGLRHALRSRSFGDSLSSLSRVVSLKGSLKGLSRDLSRLDLTASLNDLTAALSLARRRRGVTRVRIADIASAEGAAVRSAALPAIQQALASKRLLIS